VNSPDVTVIVAVYNTMPYLTRCLDSLAGQSIGTERMEIVAVDDGSTDGSGRELDRFARRHPGLVKVVHQANSGGPAVPSNRGLELATGRYVFFVGADDYLGPEALERLVAAADEYGSDVVLGRTVGVNSRYIHQEIYARDEVDVDLFDSALPWSLSNTKLFRRELIERHGLRFPEDMPVGSDQPFTLAACYHAGRISVLAGYEFYYAVRRLNARNITYRSRHLERLRCAESIIKFVAGLIEPGPRRDAILVRHFAWEVARLVEDDYRRLDPGVRKQVLAGVGELVREHLTDRIRRRLDIETRVRLATAGWGTVDDLLAVIDRDAAAEAPPTVVEGDRWYAGYPGFRDPRLGIPDEWFEVTARADWLARLETLSVRWSTEPDGTRSLAVTARSPRPDLTALTTGPVTLTAGPVPGSPPTCTVEETGTLLSTRFRIDQLLAAAAAGGQVHVVRAQVTDAAGTGSAPLRTRARPAARRAVARSGTRWFVVTPTISHRGQLVIAVVPVTARRVLARLWRR
jgi:glycosyltransferase involved in cell wall biosynthesis